MEYIKPEALVITFNDDDVITTSLESDDVYGEE